MYKMELWIWEGGRWVVYVCRGVLGVRGGGGGGSCINHKVDFFFKQRDKLCTTSCS